MPRRKLYQPSLRDDQVVALYYLKKLRRQPMTTLLREAVDTYLKAMGGTDALVPPTHPIRGRRADS